jgi:hypothetical protein
MRSCTPLSLFHEPLTAPTKSSSVAVSFAAHLVVCACVYIGLRYSPRLIGLSQPQQAMVRLIDVSLPQSERASPAAGARASTGSSSSGAAAEREVLGAMAAPVSMRQHTQTQILVQPDAPPDMLLAHPVPVPTMLAWSAPAIPTRTVVLPPRREVITEKIRPSLEAPNREPTPADLKMASSTLSSSLSTIAAGTPSPIVIQRREATAALPQSAAPSPAQPTAARILSVSNLRSVEGKIAVPLANAGVRPRDAGWLSSAAVVNGGAGAPGVQASNGSGQSGHSGKANAEGSGAADNGASGPQDESHGASAGTGAALFQAQEPGAGLDGGDEARYSHLRLPRDGQYGMVVVGSTLAEQYPETVDLWAGRLVYTVYLHVGSGKAWILQYSLPSGAATGGMRPEAPWPFDLLQPHLDAADYSADAVVVHGFVDVNGKFERLAVVFPTDFQKTRFVLNALQQWVFRPAKQNGQPAKVEVLLIIPEKDEQ